MKTKWKVILIKSPRNYNWPLTFFPRGFHYLKDAVKLVEDVRLMGGEARVEKAS